MSMQEPMQEPERTTEPEILDSGVHVRDTEHARASGAQIGVTVLAVIAILSLFFWGVNNQRTEIAGSESTQATTAAAANGDTSGTQPQPNSQAQKRQDQKEANQQQGKTAPKSNVPETTGQAVPGPAAPPAPNNARPKAEQPANPGQNGTPAQNAGAPMQPRGAGKQ